MKCDFCYRECVIQEGSWGYCNARKHERGSIITYDYNKIVALGIDPIEKKPMFHFFPGSKTLSFGLFGCNLRCLFCQNHSISQKQLIPVPSRTLTPQDLLNMLLSENLDIMSYTYSEPIVWQDFLIETAQLTHEADKYNCMVTNGSFSPHSLKRILPLIDAYNIDVKGDEHFYNTVCKGSLFPVLDALETIIELSDAIVEVTTLLIEDYHNEDMIRYLAKELRERGVQVWHLSRFFPTYRMSSHRRTSEEFLYKMIQIAQDEHIPHVYAGNSGQQELHKLRCPSCTSVLHNLEDGHCFFCGNDIYGIFTEY